MKKIVILTALVFIGSSCANVKISPSPTDYFSPTLLPTSIQVSEMGNLIQELIEPTGRIVFRWSREKGISHTMNW